MRYLSVCSGIEAASAAWHPLGWTPHAFAEIEAFPSAVLAHRYGSNMPGKPLSTNFPPNYGDMTKFKEWPDATIDVLVGGTPCQSFSVAGLRKGLDDPRGNLALTFLGIADRYGPEWLIWENVPGVLSQDEGRAFGSILGGMAELGYHVAYRVLDAQYVRVDGLGRAVPQRRRRVFVVGNLRDWRHAAAVLFEPESLSGDIAPRRETGKGTSPTISSRPTGGGGLGTNFDLDGGLIARTLLAKEKNQRDEVREVPVAGALAAEPGMKQQTYIAFSSKDYGADADADAAPTLRAMGHDGSHANAGGQVAVAFTITPSNSNADYNDREAHKAQALTGGGNSPSARGGDMVVMPYTLAIRGRGDSHDLEYRQDGTSNAILTPNGGRGGVGVGAVAAGWAVRRLTPMECERLQGFSDGYTDVPYRGKKAADGPRYKALGNSMAVNAMRWLGRRIELVSNLSATHHDI